MKKILKSIYLTLLILVIGILLIFMGKNFIRLYKSYREYKQEEKELIETYKEYSREVNKANKELDNIFKPQPSKKDSTKK